MDYYRSGPSQPTFLEATILDSFLLALVLWLAWKWVDLRPTLLKRKIAQCGFLLLFIFPLESVRLYWNQENGHWDFFSNASLLAIEAVLACGVFLAIFGNGGKGNTRIVSAARRVALLLSLLFPAMLIDFVFNTLFQEPASAYENKPKLPPLPLRPGPARRVVWVVFDEFDQHLVFELRKPKVDLPALDQLRAESVVGNHAIQTASWTTQAIPSLISGFVYGRVELDNASTLRVFPSGADWHDAPNAFKKARAIGVNTALVGWHHPYCRVIGDSLVECEHVLSQFPTVALIPAASKQGLLQTAMWLLRLQMLSIEELFLRSNPPTQTIRDEYIQRVQQQQYFEIRDRAYAEIADPKLGLIFLHFPIPHPYALYDRQHGDFELRPNIGYMDNVALVDRTLAEMRGILEKSGLWDSTSLIITSDHGVRPEVWHGHMGWSDELDRLTGGKQSELVPFIVKLAGQKTPRVEDRTFSNVVCGDLAIAILSGEVRTADNVVTWLDRQKAE